MFTVEEGKCEINVFILLSLATNSKTSLCLWQEIEKQIHEKVLSVYVLFLAKVQAHS